MNPTDKGMILINVAQHLGLCTRKVTPLFARGVVMLNGKLLTGWSGVAVKNGDVIEVNDTKFKRRWKV